MSTTPWQKGYSAGYYEAEAAAQAANARHEEVIMRLQDESGLTKVAAERDALGARVADLEAEITRLTRERDVARELERQALVGMEALNVAGRFGRIGG